MPRISYSASALKTFAACQAKYFHRYYWETPIDADHKPSESANLGSAFHKVLEVTKWGGVPFKNQILLDVCEQYKIKYEDEGAKISAMLRAFWFVRDSTEVCLVSEMNVSEIENQKVILDAIIEKENKDWYICDAKTTSKLCDYLPYQLKSDIQMEVYHYCRELVAEKLNLDIQKYKGILYRQFKKPLQKYKDGESFSDFTQRCVADYRELLVIPSGISNAAAAIDGIDNLLSKNPILPCKNFNACFDFYSKCEFFNTCHDIPIKAEF